MIICLITSDLKTPGQLQISKMLQLSTFHASISMRLHAWKTRFTIGDLAVPALSTDATFNPLSPFELTLETLHKFGLSDVA